MQRFAPIKDRMKISRLLLAAFCAAASLTAAAQPGRTSYVAPQIKTLRLYVGDDVSALPVLRLGGSDALHVSFDEMSHEYKRLAYHIEHCDTEGTPTDGLFDTEYLSSTLDNPLISDYEPSQNTTTLYTHYSLDIPNEDIRPKLSGNYRLTVTDGDEDGADTLLVTFFAVTENAAPVSLSCSTDTETDRNAQHQQVTMRVDLGSLPLRDPATEVRVMVLQNRDYVTSVCVPPTMQNGSALLWQHDRRLIFPAGNEYRKTEMISTRYPGLHGESMRWHEPFYHYTLMADQPRRNYLYDEDRDGLSVVRNDGAGDADIEADYVITHFTLQTPQLPGKDIFVDGRWAQPAKSPLYLMRYNPAAEAYEASVLMKTGYYNYRYTAYDSATGQPAPYASVEGNYFQTENEYTALVYYRPAGGRYWRLLNAVSKTYRPR